MTDGSFVLKKAVAGCTSILELRENISF